MDGKQRGTHNICTHDNYTADTQMSNESGEERRRERGTRMRTMHAHLTNTGTDNKEKKRASLTKRNHGKKKKKKRETERGAQAATDQKSNYTRMDCNHTTSR